MSEELIVYTIPEVAKILKVGRHKVERLIKGGSLKAKLVGNSFRISHANLAAFISDDEKAKTVPLTPEANANLREYN